MCQNIITIIYGCGKRTIDVLEEDECEEYRRTGRICTPTANNTDGHPDKLNRFCKDCRGELRDAIASMEDWGRESREERIARLYMWAQKNRHGHMTATMSLISDFVDNEGKKRTWGEDEASNALRDAIEGDDDAELIFSHDGVVQ